ncbi:MAG: DNA helicase RecG, partial [Elusimicrobiota bacterium]|nr:DNA helicase RecG [Elusimicrobiota bacterium]
EKDLEMRGPGEFLGKNQHGFLELDIGDISRDKEIIEIAQKEAILFFEDMKKNVYSKKEIENLNTAIKIKYGNNLELLKV